MSHKDIELKHKYNFFLFEINLKNLNLKQTDQAYDIQSKIS